MPTPRPTRFSAATPCWRLLPVTDVAIAAPCRAVGLPRAAYTNGSR
jgi:hypothetical protein